MITRKKTREVRVGEITIGGNNPIAIQSMTKTDTRDVKATVNQIKELEDAGCDIVRVAVVNEEAAKAIKEIKKSISIPLVADIHFDHHLALTALESGVDKLRINPGNIGDESKVKEIVQKAKKRSVPIRIGVNSGSLERDLYEKYNGVTPAGLVESASRHIEILENLNFEDIVISIKSSDVLLSVEAYKIFSQKYDYPLHIGITESGTYNIGSVKSSVGLGILLYHGIGDTLRVSLTSNPVNEINVGEEILKSLGIFEKSRIEFISCPTCGRTEINLMEIAEKIEKECKHIRKNIKVAVMGCVVNGPGEARDADIGIAGGKNKAVLFKKGEILRTVDEKDVVAEVLKEIHNL
ncbi:4-hydroxy-3-methylbut-2-en-1-yl diphosphate synthase [Alkalibaculum bacchi]|uniref:4-hydroxy-3-methylbut-2-en-1-yl diphosphate synthase (flavodoxin) n=1 Tax=Alkalibaculum bacchi TaxID=645887 RepID=A0A366I2F0_9FIRM|nr:4-hydroxy-3-methylbut-2-en-1-yl diphosphate synthase [Alkalibaculum bacchi]